MFFSSGYINQAIGGQNALFAQNNYLAQQMAIPMGGGGMGTAGMGPPPPPMNMPPPPTLLQSGLQHGGYGSGMAGERLAGGMMGAISNVAMPLASGGLAAAGAMGSFGMLGGMGRAASMLDPFSAVMGAGRMGFGAMGGGMAGLAGGAAAAGAAALPLYAGYKAASAYGSAFGEGAQNQMALNSTLRGNFQFQGGQQGQGFSQNQMGTIGGVVQQELNRNVFTSPAELNQLISGGSQAGMFQGVRGVAEFTKKFRTMLDTLKSVQTELGGSLTEALNFVNESRQAGVFQQMDRAQFATQVRNTSQMTGMSRQDTMSMAIQGASIARQAGGYGRQGAFGAMRVAATMGTAVSSGAISESALSEATGGLTGSDAIQAFTGNMMQRSGRFLSRPGMGRFSLYALAGQGGDLDPEMLARFQAGDLSVGQVSQAARQNVRGMGRAQALNRAGELRGQVMEQGGMSGQIGMMRLMLGDRVLNQGSDISQLVMQRRFGMSRQESEVMQGLMRNQGSIAMQESEDRVTSARGARRERLITTERSLDAVLRNVSHAVEEGMGLQDVKMAGRRFVTRISEGVDRMMSQMMGTYEGEMSGGTRRALSRMATGQMSSSDIQQMRMLNQAQALGGGGGAVDLFQEGVLQRLTGSRALGTRLETMGVNIRGGGAGLEEQTRRAQEAVTGIRMARVGVVDQSRQAGLARMTQNREETTRQLLRARLATNEDTPGAMFRQLERQGMDRNTAIAFMAQQGMDMSGTDVSMDQAGGGGITPGMVGRDLLRLVGTAMTGGTGLGALLGAQGGAAEESNFMTLETLRSAGITGTTRREAAMSRLASGGAAARAHREVGVAGRREAIRRGAEEGGAGRSMFLRAAAHTATATSMSDLSAEMLETVAQDDTFRRLTLRMSTGGPDARVALDQLNAMSMAAGESPQRRQVLRSLAEQARFDIDTTGRVGSDFIAAVRSPRMQEELQAANSQMQSTGESLSGVAGQLLAATGRTRSSTASRILGGRLQEVAGLVAGGLGNAEAANTAMGDMVRFISEASPENRTEAMGALARVEGEGEREQAQQIMAAAANRTQQRESLIGVGRRSQGRERQRMETAMQMVGGLGMGRDFSFRTGEGDREQVVSGDRASRLLRSAFRSGAVPRSGVERARGRFAQGQGGEQQRAALEAYTQQLRTAGMDPNQIVEVLGAMSEMGTARTPEERKAAAGRMQGLRDDERFKNQFENLDRRQQEQVSAQVAARDPLGAARNVTLEAIRAILSDRLTDGKPASEPAD